MDHSVLNRDLDDIPRPSVIVAGFPCQPFSFLGLGRVFEESGGRGAVVLEMIKAIRHFQQADFLLENVAAFASASHAEARRLVLDLLSRDDKYEIHERVLCSSSTRVLEFSKQGADDMWLACCVPQSLARFLGPSLWSAFRFSRSLDPARRTTVRLVFRLPLSEMRAGMFPSGVSEL